MLRGDPKHERITSVEVPIIVRGEVVGLLKRPRPLHEIQKIKFSVWSTATETLVWGLLIALAFSLLSAYVVSKNLTRPLIHISTTLRNLASGHFDARVPVINNVAYQPICDDVNFLGRALEESKETRQRWISDISHELRTPVSILNAEIESAEAGIQGSSEDMLKSMREEVVQLNQLINDLKMLSHSDLGGLNFERSELKVDQFLALLADKIRNAASKRNLNFELSLAALPSNVTLFADENRLRQVFDNLLQNSLRYTDSGGMIRLTATIADNRLQILWEDSDPSVPDESLPMLFERLYRVEGSRSRATGGSGLGLSICKSIIDAEEGEITAAHSELGGLAIGIMLPLERV
ncbi:ATP-binding protein [Pontibacterium granulatum]|uniref:ATP-binding protein n=1 Tax=Pontibacterium granulatum TaxID=2036029 RepID=UPI00249B9BAB|nr:ATP-binding protein [Pontibacterium granulatum]MDI3326262.1 ATP-binding protein [Pontibacterium granulatum]